jgi:hypothetical protein
MYNSLKIKFQLIQILNLVILLIIFRDVMAYVVQYGAFLGVSVLLFNSLLYNIVW